MRNHCVGWLLLPSYLALAIVNSYVVFYFFQLPLNPKPEPPELNITIPKPWEPGYEQYMENRYEWREDSLSPADKAALEEYIRNSSPYCNYYNDARVYVVPVSAFSVMVLVPIVLAGLCTRKIFSSTLALYTSVVIWGITLTSMILFLNVMLFDPMLRDNVDMIILGFLGAMLTVVFIQGLLSVWELKRQKIAWPVIKFSHVISINTVFLCARIGLGILAIVALLSTSFWFGTEDPAFSSMHNFPLYGNPRIKYPEYFMYPIQLVLLYGVAVSMESLLSHLLGHLHTQMMFFTTAVSFFLHGVVSYWTSPKYVRAMFNAKLPYVEVMNFSIVVTILCFVHGMLILAAPSTVNSFQHLRALGSVLSQSGPGLTQSSVSNQAGYLRSRATSLRDKFKGSDTLLFNTAAMILSSLGLIFNMSYGPRFWGRSAMLIADVVVMSRVLPLLIIEGLTQKAENVPIVKMLINTFIECGLLFVGVVGSFGWFYDEIAFAIIVNIILLILQCHNLFKNPALKLAIAKLNEEETNSRVTNDVGNSHKRLISTDSENIPENENIPEV